MSSTSGFGTSGVVVQSKKKTKKEGVAKDSHGHEVLLHPSTRSMNALIEHPDRWSIICACLELMEPSVLPDTLPNEIALHVGLEFEITMPQVQKVWHEFFHQKEEKIKHMISNAHGQAVQNGKIGEEEKKAVTLTDFNSPHHFKDRVDMDGNTHPFEDVLTMIVTINSELDGRASVRALSGELLKRCNMLIPKSTLDRILVDYRFLFHKSYLKPLLSRKNRLDRAIYCFEKIDLKKKSVTDDDGKVYIQFNDQEYKREIVLDEKLYYIDVIKARQRFSAMDSVTHHGRKVVSKTQMASLMFLVALVPPQMSPDNETYCDGKICCKPFAELKHAVKASKNRPQGTLEVVGYNVDAESFFEMMTANDGVIASVRQKLPWLVNDTLRITLSEGGNEDSADDPQADDGGGVRVRMDNAKPHIGKDNIEQLNIWARDKQINVSFVLQPAQSPDLNLLDLCIFKGLSRAANNYNVHSKNVDDILYNVMHTFDAYPSDAIARAVAFQFSVYREVLKSHGENTYELPHSNIRKRQMHGEDEIDFKVEKEVVLLAADWIRDEVLHFATLANTDNDTMGGKSQKKKSLQAKKDQWDETKDKWEKIYAVVIKL